MAIATKKGGTTLIRLSWSVTLVSRSCKKDLLLWLWVHVLAVWDSMEKEKESLADIAGSELK